LRSLSILHSSVVRIEDLVGRFRQHKQIVSAPAYRKLIFMGVSPENVGDNVRRETINTVCFINTIAL
jgi:hypothetical protein